MSDFIQRKLAEFNEEVARLDKELAQFDQMVRERVAIVEAKQALERMLATGMVSEQPVERVPPAPRPPEPPPPDTPEPPPPAAAEPEVPVRERAPRGGLSPGRAAEAERRERQVLDAMQGTPTPWGELQARVGWGSGSLSRAIERLKDKGVVRHYEGRGYGPVDYVEPDTTRPPTQAVPSQAETAQPSVAAPADEPAPETAREESSPAPSTTRSAGDRLAAAAESRRERDRARIEENKAAILLWAEEHDDWFNNKQAAEGTGLNHSSMTNWVRELVDEGKIERKGPFKGPNVRFRFARDRSGVVTLPPQSAPPSESRDGATEPVEQEGIDAEALRAVRDWAAQQKDGAAFMAATVGVATELGPDVALAALEELARQGVVSDESPSADMRLFAYVKPRHAGRAAEMDMQRREQGVERGTTTGSVAVEGTGQKPRAHPDVQPLLEAVARQIGWEKIKQVANGHWQIMAPGGKVLIAGTPSSARTTYTDRARLRRHGIKLAAS
jgi:DNA-binding Lrp family transcriptional regulator